MPYGAQDREVLRGNLNAYPVSTLVAPKKFQYLEKRISLLCCALAGVVLCLSVADDINSTLQTRAQTQEFDKRIAAAEKAATPISINVRLRNLLQEIDGKIIPSIKAGQTKFEGGIAASQFIRLQTIAKEHDADKLILIDPSSVRVGIGMGGEGVTYNVAFTVDPKVLQDQ
jgi:hypothetical protein